MLMPSVWMVDPKPQDSGSENGKDLGGQKSASGQPSRPADGRDTSLLTDLLGRWDDDRPLTGIRRFGLVILSMVLALLIVGVFVIR
jgi:hypothetical protein